jgi:hypothetical protein
MEKLTDSQEKIAENNEEVVRQITDDDFVERSRNEKT